jgi:hypothetical protein
VSSEPLPARSATAETVGGLLSAIAIFVAAIGVAWHPLRLIPFSLVLALIGSGMTREHRRFASAAFFICVACFFLGMTVAALAENPLW